MKIFRNTIIVWGLVLGFNAITHAQAPNSVSLLNDTMGSISDRMSESITIVPAAPTTDDSVKIIVCGEWGSSCPKVSYAYSVIAQSIQILGSIADAFPICAAVLTSWFISVPVGKLPAGMYTVTVNIEGGYWSVVGTKAFTVTPPCVICWPADTNNDGVVNQADILPLGLYWGYAGPSCPNCSISWVPRCCPPWTPIGATCADTNCDGVVNQADVLLIGLNWGKTHTNFLSSELHLQDR